MMPTTHQNCHSGPPGMCGSVTFIPYMPVSTVSGRKIVEISVSTFMTLFNWFETAERCASRMPEIRSWKNIASSERRTR